MLMVNYPQSNVTGIDLESMYFACDLDEENDAVFLPAACTVTITGYQGERVPKRH